MVKPRRRRVLFRLTFVVVVTILIRKVSIHIADQLQKKDLIQSRFYDHLGGNVYKEIDQNAHGSREISHPVQNKNQTIVVATIEIRNGSRECDKAEIDWEDGIKPRYVLNPNAFLIPYLYNGPNNQMIGFQQSIIVSLLLNRTLVLPTFYEHALLGVEYRTPVEAKYRIDIQKLRAFISVLPLKKAFQLCDGKLDAIFATGPWHKKRNLPVLVQYDIETGFQGLKYRDDFDRNTFTMLKQHLYSNATVSTDISSQFAWWPRNRSDTDWMSQVIEKDEQQSISVYPRDQSLPISLQNLREIYNTEQKCALYWRPFRQFHFKPSQEEISAAYPLRNFENMSLKKAVNLYVEIMNNLDAPRSVRVLADEYRRKYLSKNYIAVHWRYDDVDFFDYLCKGKALDKRTKFCEDVRKATNETAIAKAILYKLRELKRDDNLMINSVYFAAPPTLPALIRGVKREVDRLKKKILSDEWNSITMKSREDLYTFLLQYRKCDVLNEKQLPDTVSQVEMNLCINSEYFLFSRQSTWSKNVLINRYISKGVQSKKTDNPIIDFTLKTMNR